MIGFVAFADNRFKGSLERLRVQAQRMGAFDLISINSESEIPPDYLKRHQDRLTPACRGFGYWCWKPLFALRELQRTPDLEILIYCDAGCHLWPGGRRRLDAYIRTLRHSPHDFLGFQMFNIERQWTKADLFAHHDIPLTHPHASSGQIWGGVWMVKNTQSIREFLEEWIALTERQPHLFDDQDSKTPNATDFVEHRHDQSHFSLSVKKIGAALFPDKETCPRKAWGWDSLRDYPFHARRHKHGRYNRWTDREMRYRIHLAVKMKRFWQQ